MFFIENSFTILALLFFVGAIILYKCGKTDSLALASSLVSIVCCLAGIVKVSYLYLYVIMAMIYAPPLFEKILPVYGEEILVSITLFPEGEYIALADLITKPLFMAEWFFCTLMLPLSIGISAWLFYKYGRKRLLFNPV